MSERGPFPVAVETEENKGKRKSERKSHTFSATLLGFTMADYWEGHSADPLRPALAVFATSLQEEGPFVMNLKKGQKLRAVGIGSSSQSEGYPMEFMKSAGYLFGVQRYRPRWEDGALVFTGGSVIEVVIQSLVDFDPGMSDPDVVRFLLSVKEDKLRNQALTFPTTRLDEMLARYDFPKVTGAPPPYDRATVLAEGRRFAVALEKRGDPPVVGDPLFGVQLLLSALARGFALRSETRHFYSPYDRGRFFEVGMARVKRAPGLAFELSQGDCAKWFAAELAAYKAWASRVSAPSSWGARLFAP